MRMKRLRSLRLGMTVMPWEENETYRTQTIRRAFYWAKIGGKMFAGAQLTN